MVAQDPSKTRTQAQLAQAWREDAYGAGCMKKVITRQPTQLERQNGQREVPVTEIIMRLDEPGVFYDNQGNRVDDELARTAGYPVSFWRRKGEKQRALAEAKARIEAEFAQLEAEADAPATDAGEA